MTKFWNILGLDPNDQVHTQTAYSFRLKSKEIFLVEQFTKSVSLGATIDSYDRRVISAKVKKKKVEQG